MSPFTLPANRALLALLLVCSVLALAFHGEEGGRVKVSVVAILASEQPKEEDPRLACIAREVRKMEPKLTGFRMAKIHCLSLPVGTRQTFELVGDQQATVKVEKGADAQGWVELRVAPPLLGDISYRIICGKFFPVITRYRTPQNEMLILAICVKPCPGK
jgi:hypothetical protein